MPQRLKTDYVLFLTILGMVAFGLVIVYSASSVAAQVKLGSSTHYFFRQLGWALLSLPLLMYCKGLDYRRLRAQRTVFVAIGTVLAMLVAVYFLDWRSHRWFKAGSLSLQPSEFAKPALTLFLAYFLSLRDRAVEDWSTLKTVGAVTLLLSGLVVISDLGTAMVLLLTAAVVLYAAGLNRRWLAWGGVGLLLVAAGAVVAKPYRMSRIIGYVDPNYELLDELDPAGHIKRYVQNSLATRDPGYQARQSKIAVGAGGVLGAGLMHGRQKLFYLPEAHTDFIYAVVAEELGLWGSAALVAGFAVILWRGLRLWGRAPDQFGRLLALAVTTSIVVQALINMSVVLDMGPTKGIPLPLISVGGSSLLSTLLLLGLLLSVSEQSG